MTDPAVPTPGSLVRRIVGLVSELDQRGAGLSDLVGSAGVGFLAERSASMGLPSSGLISAGGASQLVPCSDGWISLSLARTEDVELVPALFETCSATADDVWDVVRTAASEHPVKELVERARMLGLPCAGIGDVVDDRPALADQLGQAGPTLGLDGVVVVNLASLWAGPLAADVLARLGARVITVESTRRPDGGRRARRFFAELHGRTESVALDLTEDAEHTVLRELIRAADVVIEGSRPRALEHMGVFAGELLRSSPGPRIWVSITAYGRAVPEREWVGFGDDAAAAGALIGHVADAPRFVADAVADPLTGLTAATSAVQLLESGGRWLVDVALARTARSACGGWVPHAGGEAARPRRRKDPGGALPLGRDTDATLRSLGLRSRATLTNGE